MPKRQIMKTPRSVEIEITARCNLRCRYCYYFDNPAQQYTDLPLADWLAFIREMETCGIMAVSICGGEPFVRTDLREILQAVTDHRMRYTILTNGSLLNDDWGEFLARTGRCDVIQISLDGSRPETHDACRGTGSFDAAVAGIRVLQRHRVPVAVRVTITRYNLGDLEHAARFILEELGLPVFGINSAGYLGSCKQNATDIQLTTEDRYTAMNVLDRLTRKYGDRITALAGPLAEVRMYSRMMTAAAEDAPAFEMGGRLTGCGCIFNRLSVRSDGSYIPCNMVPHMVLGNIREHSLADIWQNSPELNAMRRRVDIQLADLEFCRDCPYAPYCTGNCPGLAYSLTGDINLPNPADCLRNYLQDGGRVPGVDSR